MRERRYAMVMSLLVGVAFIGCLVGSVAYTRHVQDQADRRWCRSLALETDPTPPPTTPRGRDRVREFQKLYDEFGCDR